MNSLSPLPESDNDPLASPERHVDDAHFDVTPMVDVVFMMNIFFLVTWVSAALAEIDLPAASHCTSADQDTSVILTVLAGDGGDCLVYLGPVEPGNELPDGDQLEDRIGEAVEIGKSEGMNTVLIKAEKTVRLRDIVRIASAATAQGGMNLNLAVMEKE